MSAFFEANRELDKKIELSLIHNDECQPHFHSNIELVYVIDGKIDININGNIKTLEKGWVSIANSYDIHVYSNAINSQTFLLIIPVELVKSYTAMLRLKVFSKPFIKKCPQTEQIYSILKQMHKTDGPGSELILKGYAYCILGLLLNLTVLIDKPSQSSTDLARKILLFIQQNYLNQLSINVLAKHFGYNKDYLSRFFNSYLGWGFNSYLNAIRARHAAYLMSNGNTDLTDVAFSSGFSNYRTFNRAFNQSYQMPPSDYKRLISGK